MTRAERQAKREEAMRQAKREEAIDAASDARATLQIVAWALDNGTAASYRKARKEMDRVLERVGRVIGALGEMGVKR